MHSCKTKKITQNGKERNENHTKISPVIHPEILIQSKQVAAETRKESPEDPPTKKQKPISSSPPKQHHPFPLLSPYKRKRKNGSRNQPAPTTLRIAKCCSRKPYGEKTSARINDSDETYVIEKASINKRK